MIPTPILAAIAAILDSRPDNPDSFVDIGPECFAGVWVNGRVVISYKGENYTPLRPSVRTRIRNLVVGILNARDFRATSARKPAHRTDQIRADLPKIRP